MMSHVLEFEGTGLLSLVLFKVSLVDSILDLKFPLLFDLIVVDDKSFSLKCLTI